MAVKSIGRRQALVLGAAALVTAGCGERKSSPGASAGKGDKVSIVNTAGSFAATLQRLMQDRGYLQAMGLAPSFTTVSDGSKVIGALISGDADICTASGFGQVFPAIERGGAIKILAGAETLLLHLIYSAHPEIKTLKDLEGRTVGVGSLGALLHTITVGLLRKNNIDPAKITFVNVGSSADVFRAVAAKVVDAGPSELDYLEQRAKYNVHGLAGGNFWDGLPEYTNQASYAAEHAIQTKRDVLVRTLAAYARLYRFISSPDSKDDYLKARKAALGKDEPQEALAQWQLFQKHASFATNLVLAEDRVRYMQDLNVSLGVQKSVLPYDRVADMSLAKDALKLLG